jgi:F0F1-type ATP synthase assembly protein I
LKSSGGPAIVPQRMFFNYKKNSTWAENLSIVMQIGLTMAGCIVFCFFVGFYIDRWLGTRGIFITIFTLLGVAGGGNVAYRQIMEIFREEGGTKRTGPERDEDGSD